MFEFRNLYLSCEGELTGLYPSNCVLSHLFLKTRAHFHFHFVSFASGPIMLVSVSFLCHTKQNDKQRSDKHIPYHAACNIMIIFTSLFEINDLECILCMYECISMFELPS